MGNSESEFVVSRTEPATQIGTSTDSDSSRGPSLDDVFDYSLR